MISKSNCAFLLLVGSVAAQTPFPARNVLSGQAVVVPKGDYLLTVQCNIQPGGKLTVEAGTTIKVDGPGIVFNNRGILEISGTQEEPIRVFSDPGKNCGTLFCPWSSGLRPQLSVNHLDWTSTINANCFFLQATDFSIANSRITNRAVTTAANRVCIALNTGSVGTVSLCYLDGCSPEVPKPSVGLAVNQNDVVETFDIVIDRTTTPVLIRKPVVFFTGAIE